MSAPLFRNPRSVVCLAVFLVALVGPAGPARAQRLRPSHDRRSAWLDLRPRQPGAAPQTAPSWVEAVEFVPGQLRPPVPTVSLNGQVAAETVPATNGDQPLGTAQADSSLCRVRLRRPAGVAAADHLYVRLFFSDQPGAAPRITAWDELGNALVRSGPLGAGLGLPSSAALSVPMDGVDYLEIEAPGDPYQLRSLFLSWTETRQVVQSSDFPTLPAGDGSALTPFRAAADPLAAEAAPTPAASAATAPAGADRYHYGTVTASLQTTPVRLGAPDAAAGVEIPFELENPPMVALLTFEILNPETTSPPKLFLNDKPLGPAHLVLPDLADPGYQGELKGYRTDLSFHYTGWVRAQKVVAGPRLNAGPNRLVIQLANPQDPVAVRAVQVQLKYNWEKFDYLVSPGK